MTLLLLLWLLSWKLSGFVQNVIESLGLVAGTFFFFTTHCHNWLHAVPDGRTELLKSQIHGKPSAVRRLRNNNVSSDPSRKGRQSNCAQSSISLMSEGARRFVWQSLCQHLTSVTQSSPLLLQNYICQSSGFLLDGGRRPSQQGSPLFEYMYPVILSCLAW